MSNVHWKTRRLQKHKPLYEIACMIYFDQVRYKPGCIYPQKTARGLHVGLKEEDCNIYACSWFYQWYQWYTNIVQGYTNGTIGNTIGTNGTICSPNCTVCTIGKPIVLLVSQWCHWLPRVPLVKLPIVQLGELRTEPM